ncbi:MAG: PRC-barrel domain-containing protein [Candidatus Omnitrophica bacterium]|nr:PRC-barrel domain-containing protein [Candidatus Omnitrophota bacterium]
MAKIVIAKQLGGKRVITNEGEDIGKLVDLIAQEQTGKIQSLLVEPNLDNPRLRELPQEEGLISIPYEAVLAASDYIIIDKKNIK